MKDKARPVGVVLALAVLALGGCSREEPESGGIGLLELTHELTNLTRIARLDTPGCALISSYDRAGGNKDYNNSLRKSSDKGWVVLADLEGPGYVSRFWFTGGDNNRRVRMYFDDEWKPRIDMTLNELCGTREPFLPPLAIYENYCCYNLVPLPYAKRLRIETQEGGQKPDGQPFLFHQINYSSLPKGTVVRSFPKKLTPGELVALRAARDFWAAPGRLREVWAPSVEASVTLPPNTVSNVLTVSGPAVLRALRLEPAFDALPSATARDALLRNVIVRIRWNDAASASVEAPLGDFFGSFWHRARYDSFYFGLATNTFESRFPMPFETSAQVSLENQGPDPVDIRAAAAVEPLKAWDPAWGYFHSGWYRTTPQDAGRPHPVLSAKGRGKYVGCVLSATSMDRTFWMLEGDESIRKDSEPAPGWLGTGLEDYFNGGWYYQNVLARPLHGLPFKTFFRTIQYRVHLMDPVCFDSSLDMAFERGPDNASHGYLESVCFYYLDKPSAAFARLGAAVARIPPDDPMAKATVMPELWNDERFNDYAGAREFVDRFLAKFPDFEFAPILRLRQVAYDERMKGFAAVAPAYERIAATESNKSAQAYAQLLLWYNQDARRVLVGAYCNTETKVFLDGSEIGAAANPQQMLVWPRVLAPGRHVVALQAAFKPYPDWIQFSLRAHSGDIDTTVEWKHAVNPAGDWRRLDYDDSGWAKVGGTGVKGPPEEPYIWVFPDPFVDMQSKATGLRGSIEWASRQGAMVYRKTFEIR